ncbi:uncharacterized protein Tco025E_05611 [Trypanosoma conorhini]|uniref:Ubiquitin-like domain-containing protein n=1 Tax=Trypanosoma conorhini TaxID=83891 RepID=A0A422PBL3_9TRYP|nr:uncharacterized protein Tco025E_05611 [Trypanosoma conorhini]RNF15093.1 hypothetical protein Tco025E_05611 [Trypanosoma conorhini]
MISVKVFALPAGPRTLRRVQIDKMGTIAAQLPALSAAIGETIEIASATFYAGRGKSIDKEPLATDLPLDAIGITDGSLLAILPKRPKVAPQHEEQKEVKGSSVDKCSFSHVVANTRMSETSSSGRESADPRKLAVPTGEAKGSSAPPAAATRPPPARTADANGLNSELLLSLVREVANAKQEMASFWDKCRVELKRDGPALEKESLLEVLGAVTRLTEQQQIVENAIGSLQEQARDRVQVAAVLASIHEVNANILSELATARQQKSAAVHESVAAIMQLQGKLEGGLRSLALATLPKWSLQSPVAAASCVSELSHLPASSSTILEDEYALHESLLQQFFAAVGYVGVTATELLTHFDSLGDLYAAVSIRYNLQHSPMQEAVQRRLRLHLPPLAPAAPIICYLHDGREAEYVEAVVLRSIGLHLHPPQLWIEVAHPPGGVAACSNYYFSSLVGLSQREKPRCLQKTHSDVCRFPELSSVCPRLGLCNPQWTEHDIHANARLRRSQAAAILLSQRPDLLGNMDAVLELYAGREETLWKLLTVGAFK